MKIDTPLNLDDKMFKALTMNIKPIDSDLDCVALVASIGAYQLSFYALRDNDYKLYVEDFGYRELSKWVQIKPTPCQLLTMNDLIAQELKRLQDQEDEQIAYELACKEGYNTIRDTRNHINTNFYTQY